ncbi:MAG: adenine deaminase [Nitrospirae bacterium]|nr:adenine deaminase [Nitrospirota bacterium]
MNRVNFLKNLTAVARGAVSADLVIKNSKIVDLFNGRLIRADAAIYNDTIAGIGSYKGKKTIDAKGNYLMPGFIDGHIHLESTMLSPFEFAKLCIANGTTAVVIDPHEIANVAGIAGIKYILNAAKNLPLDFYIMAPSCVPASNLETYGHRITASDIRRLLKSKRAIGLAEVMDFSDVANGKEAMLKKIAAAEGRIIDGHAPLLSGRKLSAYIAAGPSSDHEATNINEGREKLSLGMHLMIREGSIAKDLKSLIPLVNEHSLSNISFVSDDLLPTELIRDGHINRILRKAVSLGLDPIMAIRMATLNTARYFNLKRIGAVAPGYKADMVLVKDLKGFKVYTVIKSGKVVYKDGECKISFNKKLLPPFNIINSVKARFVNERDLLIKAKNKINVIGLIPNEILTRWLRLKPKIKNDVAVSDAKRDILKIAVADRHKASGNIGCGFVKGIGLKKGAIATSIAHDSHNIISVGENDKDMAIAINRIIAMKGGLVIVKDSRMLGELSLPIAGLMSDKSARSVAGSLSKLERIARRFGAKTEHPFTTLSFLSLPVIPELRVTDLGMVDVNKGRIIF